MRAADPEPLVRDALADLRSTGQPTGGGRVCVIAAGKAAWPMMRAATRALGARIALAAASGPRGAGGIDPRVEWFEGAHPLPDDASGRAGTRALAIAAEAKRAGDTLLVLLSGGGSAMLAAPVTPVPLAAKRALIQSLLLAGADIGQVNCVRKHVSSIKGGRLAAAAGRSVTIAISDVHQPEDDPGTIASGPTAADTSTARDALDVIGRLRVTPPAAVRAHLEAVRDGRAPETVRPGDPRLAAASFSVIANRRTAASGAELEARRRGYAVRVVDAPTRGEAREAGRRFAELAFATRPLAGAACVIASGETTVTVRGAGKGGRNQEFVLGAAPVLARGDRLALVASIGTDGVDGPTDAAGALAASTTLARCEALGIDLAAVLARNDAYPALQRLGDLITWGPTFTNVGDVHVLLTMGP